MFKTPVSVLIAFGLLTISLSYKTTTEVKDGIPNNFGTAPFQKLDRGMYYFELKWKGNWFEANDRCHAMDAELISFQTIEELNMINKYLTDNRIEDDYWTAGYDLGKHGRHVWISTGQPLLNALWAPTQPDNSQGIEHCDELRAAGSKRLNDLACEKPRLYICEKPLPKTTTVVVW